MAITFVGSNKVDSSSGNSLTVTMPAAATTDDFAILYGRSDKVGAAPVLDITTAGWTKLVNVTATIGRDRVDYIWYKKLTSGSEADPVMTSTVTDQISLTIHVFRGVDTADPFDATYQTDNGQNDLTPINPPITAVTANACLLLFHGATHDDITAAGLPTTPSGLTLGETIIGGTKDWRGQVTAYLLDVGAPATLTPTAWTHSGVASSAEWTVFTLALRAAAGGGAPDPVITNAEDEVFVDQEQTITITGTTFEATQGTGKIEIGDNATYGSANLVSLQVNSWGDTSIDFDMEETGTGNPIADDLTLGALWLFVTNDSGNVSASYAVTVNAAGATWGSALNANWSQAVDENFRVRFLIQETDGGAYPDQTFQLQYNLASAGWNDVNGTSSVVRSSATSNVVDADDTTQLIGSGTFVTPNDGFDEETGEVGEVGGSGLDGNGNDEIEFEFCIQIRSADVSNGQTLQLRIVEGDATVLDTYTSTPTITVVEAGGAAPLRAAMVMGL